MDQEPLFGRWLRRRRKALDLTQKQLARRVGCSPATIRKIEAEQRRPSRSVAMRLAEELGVEEGERQAFVSFARSGWSGDPPGPPSSAGELPSWRLAPALPALAPGPGAAPPGARHPHGEPAVPSAHGEFAPPAAPNGTAALFVGRERALAELEGHLSAALAGRGAVAFVTGEPGSGKTALMAEFARRAESAHPDLLCAVGTCNAFTGAGDPYLPFRDLLEMLCGDLESRRWAGPIGAERRRRLRAALPEVALAVAEEGPDLVEAFDLPIAPPGQGPAAGRAARDAATTQPRIFEQYARVLRRVAARRPLLLLVDDLQWADGASVALLFHLGRRLEGGRVLLVGAYRPEEVAQARPADGGRHPLEPVVAELAGRFGDIRVDLDQIPTDEARSFLDALLDAEPNALGEGFRAALFARTEGHPLFAVELLRAMRSRGDLRRDPHGRWVEGPHLDWRALPARVTAVIEQRLARLGRRHRDALNVASVEGEAFTAEVVARVLGIDELRLVRALSQTLQRRHRLVTELEEAQPGRTARTRYRFAHALFQRHLYDGLGAGERRLLHAGVAGALEELHREDPDEIAAQLAHHYGRAGDVDRERHHLYRAGVRAQRLAAFDEAARLYRSALDRWPGSDRAGRAEARRRLAECLWLTGRLADALEISAGALRAFRELGDLEAAGALERQMGRICWELGDRDRALRHYHAALRVLQRIPAGVELARAVSSISQMHMLASEFEQAIGWGERAAALARDLGADEVAVHALCNLGIARVTLGQHEDGLAMLRESARRAVALGLPHDAGRAYHGLAESLLWLCRYPEARAVLGEMLDYVERVHVALFVDTARIMLVELDWLEGEWRSALSRLESLAGEWRGTPPDGFVRLVASTCRAAVWNDLGRPGEAIAELEGGLAAARRSAEQQIIAPFVGQLARAYAAAGRDAEAATAMGECLSWVASARHVAVYGTVTPLLYACGWFAARGGSDRARAYLRQLERIEEQARTPETAAAAREAEGSVALHAGGAEVAVAAERLRAAVALWEGLRRPFDLRRALAALARAEAASGDAPAAHSLLERAAGITARLESQLGARGRPLPPG